MGLHQSHHHACILKLNVNFTLAQIQYMHLRSYQAMSVRVDALKPLYINKLTSVSV